MFVQSQQMTVKSRGGSVELVSTHNTTLNAHLTTLNAHLTTSNYISFTAFSTVCVNHQSKPPTGPPSKAKIKSLHVETKSHKGQSLHKQEPPPAITNNHNQLNACQN